MTTLLVPFAPPTPTLPAHAPPPASPSAPTGPIDDRAERVVRGAAFLDRAVPNWADRIHFCDLHMAYCGTCVLGQLFGDFYQGTLELLGIDPGCNFFRAWSASDARNWATRHGFADPGGARAYAALRDLWVAVILARRGAGAGLAP